MILTGHYTVRKEFIYKGTMFSKRVNLVKGPNTDTTVQSTSTPNVF